MTKFQKSLVHTLAARSRVPEDLRPLFDHLVNLAKDSHRNPLYAKRAGRELRKARRLAGSTGFAVPLRVEPFSDVLGSEGIMGAYELPEMQERVGGPYELPIIGGCTPPSSVAGHMWGPATLGVRRRSMGLGPDYVPIRSLRSLTAIAGASYAIECIGYEVAHDTLLANANGMIAGWPAGSEFEVGSIFGSIANFAKGAVKSVGHAVAKATAPIRKTVSAAANTLIEGVRKYNPVALAKVAAIKAKALAGDLANSVVFKTLGALASKALAPALMVIKAVGPVLPYVQSVLSFVPGVGSGISAALGAAQALADGRRIDEAIVAAAKSAIPGGPLATTAFDAAWGLAHGRPVDSVALEALRNNLPGDLAKKAFDTGLALATAKNAQERRAALGTAVLGAVASNVKIPTAITNIASQVQQAAQPAINAVRTVQNIANQAQNLASQAQQVARPAIAAVQAAQNAQRTVAAVRSIAQKNPAAAVALARAAALRKARAAAAHR